MPNFSQIEEVVAGPDYQIITMREMRKKNYFRIWRKNGAKSRPPTHHRRPFAHLRRSNDLWNFAIWWLGKDDDAVCTHQHRWSYNESLLTEIDNIDLRVEKKITISTGRRTPTGFHATDQGQSNLLTCQETRIKYFTRKKKTARLIYKSPETIHWFMIPCREKPNNGAMRVPVLARNTTHTV